MKTNETNEQTAIRVLLNDCIDSLDNTGALDLQEDGGYVVDRLSDVMDREDAKNLYFPAIWRVVNAELRALGYDID